MDDLFMADPIRILGLLNLMALSAVTITHAQLHMKGGITGFHYQPFYYFIWTILIS